MPGTKQENEQQSDNILVIDDNPRNLALLQDILGQSGYTVRPAITGNLALLSASNKVPDLILLDIRLPDIDGYEVCRRLKADAKTADVPVIFISALDDPLDKIKAFTEGGIDYITKPFQAEEVVARIRTHLSLRYIQLELKERNKQLKEEVGSRLHAQNQLQDAHTLLESRVQRRTEQLAQAVQALELEVDERKQTETALRESEERYRVAIENESAGIVIVDAGAIVFLNNRFLRIFGYLEKEDALDISFLSFFHPDDVGSIEEMLNTSYRGERDDNPTVEIRGVSSGKQLVWLEVHAVATSYQGREVSLVYLRDIAVRKKAFEERTLLATAVEQAAESIMITDNQTRILYVNPFFENLTGYRREEIAGQTPRFLQSGIHDVDFYRQLRHTLDEGQNWQGRITNRCKDGSIIDEDAVISPVFDATGKTTHFIAVKRDVTRTLQMEKQLQQAQKMEAIGTLAGGIAHDFNNILGAIMGCAEVAMAELDEGDRVQADLKRVLSAGQRARQLVQQILAFSRQSENDSRPLQMQPIIKETVKFLRASLPATVEIKTGLTKTDWLVMADPVQIQQILLNLSSNAAHAIGITGGLLDIRLTPKNISKIEAESIGGINPGEFLQLSVRDTGHGMSRVILDRIFDPFFTTKAIGEGTGLGLSVVHGIITDIGGRLIVESEAGLGTTFHIYLAREKSVGGNAESPPAVHLSDHGEKVMVIDDEVYLADTMKRTLLQLGYRPEVYTSSAHALERFTRHPGDYDIIVTDLTMPEVNGDELVREIRKIHKDIPVILCTGYSDGISTDAPSLGIHTILYKPVLQWQLAKALHDALKSVNDHNGGSERG